MALDHHDEGVNTHEEKMGCASNPEAVASESFKASGQPYPIAPANKPGPLQWGKQACIHLEGEKMG